MSKGIKGYPEDQKLKVVMRRIAQFAPKKGEKNPPRGGLGWLSALAAYAKIHKG